MTVNFLVDPGLYAWDWRALPSFVAAGLIALTAALIVRWERGTRVSWMLAGFSTMFVIWSAGRGLQRMVVVPDALVDLSRLQYALVAAVIPLLYHFVCIVLHKERERMPLILVSWTLGGFLALLAAGTPWVVEGWYVYPWGLEPRQGWLGYVLMLAIGGLIGSSALDLIAALRKSHPASRDRARIRLFGFGLVALYATLVDFLPGLGFAVYPAYGASCITIFTITTAWITWRYGLVEVSAEVVANEIAGLLRGALLVLDEDGVIQYANESSAATLGVAGDALTAKSARDLFGEAFAPQNLALLGRARGVHAEKEILHHSGLDSPRNLSLSVVAARDHHDRDFAYVCLLRDITEQKRADAQRLAEGYTDTLTGLPNRSLFLSLVDNALRRAHESGLAPPAVCFLGLDRLRVINEDLGYSVGDRVLVELATRLQRATSRAEMLARLGGDEFGILVEHPESVEAVRALATRLQEAIQQPLSVADQKVYLSSSIGIAHVTPSTRNGSDLLGSAGAAMYQVKAAGGDGIAVLTSSEPGARRIQLEAELRRALEANQFRVHYQPIVDLAARRVSGFEALVRWQHPLRGLILPADFLDFAEEVGLLPAIGGQVLERALTDLRRLREGLGDVRVSVSVNLSEDELRVPDLYERSMALLALNGLEPGALRFEVLERVAMVAPVREVLDRLSRNGVRLYVDDFGTGYSALARLHELPVSTVKVDRGFVRTLALAERGDKVVSAIIAMARSLNLDVIAEGVAQAADVRCLRNLGCTEVQGFYFAEALPFEAALEFARDRDALDRKIASTESRAANAAS